MARSQRRCREPAVLAAMLACAVAWGACGGDAESAAEDGLPVSSDTTTSQTESVEAVSPPADQDDPVADEGLEEVGAAVGEDSAVLEGEALADDETPEPPSLIRIPAGTRIDTAPDEDISTAAYRADDPVIVTVVRDVLGENGELLLPQGVKLLGRVRTSMSSGGRGEPAILEIDFETLSTDRYERPIEGTVVNRPVILDPVAARRRRSASLRVAARTVVPGLIMAGTIVEVELRAPVEVPWSVALEGPLIWGDSLMLRGDTVGRRGDPVPGDSLARRDTIPGPSGLPPTRSRSKRSIAAASRQDGGSPKTT